ncbi:MAG TPA: hypothetical protein VFQ68_44740 [Streptosporangiaceae bacterium]|nr:hypothetical protein [Streptosporangiaceae bacterium]
MDRLKPLDALFVEAEDEDPHTSMAIASIAVFEGPPPSHEEFLVFSPGGCPWYPSTAGSSVWCRSAWDGPSGWTIRISISAITSGAPPCQRPEGTSSSPS